MFGWCCESWCAAFREPVACCVRVLTRTGVAAPFYWLQKSIKSKRQTVRESNFPKRRFAVAAQA